MKYKSTGYVLKRLATHLRVLTQHVCSHGLGSDRSHFDLSNIHNYSTTLNFGVLPLVEVDHVTR